MTLTIVNIFYFYAIVVNPFVFFGVTQRTALYVICLHLLFVTTSLNVRSHVAVLVPSLPSRWDQCFHCYFVTPIRATQSIKRMAHCKYVVCLSPYGVMIGNAQRFARQRFLASSVFLTVRCTGGQDWVVMDSRNGFQHKLCHVSFTRRGQLCFAKAN